MHANEPPSDPHSISRDHLELAALGQLNDDALQHLIDTDPDLQMQIEQIRKDNAFLDEFAGAVRQHSSTGGSLDAHDGAVEGYTVKREISRGAQGVVYEALQERTHRRVALKTLIQGSFATSRQRERFEREVELVAAMKHPGIVTIYEGGQAESGQMYVAMEYIEGDTLDVWAESALGATPTSADIRRAMRLVAKLCDAMNFAHQRGVMHRDIKPGNILVDADDQPHVLDFGLAKVVDGPSESVQMRTTRAGEFLGTFAYAAPEQFKGDPNIIDIRTDVYAIGAVLYELLTRQLPHDLSGDWTDVFQKLTTAEAESPSTVNRAVDLDADTMIRKAMALDADRRYQSAGALRDDIERYLDGRPIDARRDSTLYVWRKTLRRRWKTCVAILLIVLTGSIWVAREIEKSIRITASDQFMIDALERTDWSETDDRVSVDSFLAGLASLAEDGLPNDVAFRSRFWSALGKANLGRPPFGPAEEQLLRALDLQRSIDDGPSPLLAQRMFDVARMYWKQARYDEALAVYQDVLTMRTELYGPEHLDVARTISHIAASYRGQGLAAKAEPLYRSALEMRERLPDASPGDIANSRNSLALCQFDLGHYTSAIETYEKLLREFRTIFPDWEQNWRYARILNNYGRCQIELNELDDAITSLQQALDIKKYYHGVAAHPDVAKSQIELAEALLLTGALGSAAATIADAIDTVHAAYDGPHDDTARAYVILGRIQLAQHELAEAEASFVRARAMYVETRPAGHWVLADVDSDLAQCALDRNDLESAAGHLEGRAALMTEARPSGDRRLIVLLERRLLLALLQGNQDDAKEYGAALEEARRDRPLRRSTSTDDAEDRVG